MNSKNLTRNCSDPETLFASAKVFATSSLMLFTADDHFLAVNKASLVNCSFSSSGSFLFTPRLDCFGFGCASEGAGNALAFAFALAFALPNDSWALPAHAGNFAAANDVSQLGTNLNLRNWKYISQLKVFLVESRVPYVRQ